MSDSQLQGAGHSCEAQHDRQYVVRRYRPLDVKSWGEAWRQTTGWLLVPAFAVLTAILLLMYEMKYLTIADRDTRDMYLDQRLMNTANNYFHKHFINAEICCNADPIVFGEPSQGCMPTPTDLSASFTNTYAQRAPFCPPLISIQCPSSLTSTACNQARAALYPLAGLDPVTGKYRDCLAAGRVLVAAQLVSSGRPLLLEVRWQGDVVDELPLGDPLNINITDVAALVDRTVRNYTNNEYVSPNVRLSKAFQVDGRPAKLAAALRSTGLLPVGPRGGERTIDPWPKELFNFPGMGARCPNTSTLEQWWLSGYATVHVPTFNYSHPSTMVSKLTFLQDSMLFSPWRLEVGTRPLNRQFIADDPDDAPTLPDAGGDQDMFTLSVITSMKVYVGMVREAGACMGWMLDTTPITGTQLSYTPVYTGPLAVVTSLAGRVSSYSTNITMTVWDVGAPQRIQLPFYGGMWYIAACFAMAGIWLFTLGPFILFALPLIWWNVRSNRGLPPVIYRYMKKYRGW